MPLRCPDLEFLSCQDLVKFAMFLPDIDPDKAYFLRLFARAKPMRELGINVKDKQLDTWSIKGGEQWREMYVIKVARAALLQQHSDKVYLVHKRENGRLLSFPVPPVATSLYTQVNPCRVLDATIYTIKEILDGYATAVKAGLKRSLGDQDIINIGMPNTRFKAVCANKTEKFFIDIDIDDKKLIDEVLPLIDFMAPIGFAETRRGGHLLVRIRHQDKNKLKRLFSEVLPKIKELGKKYTNQETGAPLIEINEQAMVPTPGTYHKGHLVKFRIIT